MKTLTDERWQEIRDRVDSERTFAFNRSMLIDVLQQHDHLAAQIKQLADYVMSERSDDPAWQSGEGACAMAVEIMKRGAKDIKEMNETIKWLGEGYDDPPVMTRTMIEDNNKKKLAFPPFKIGK